MRTVGMVRIIITIVRNENFTCDW